MVTDEQYDGLVNTIQREFANMIERDFKREEEISNLKSRIAYLEQFAPNKNLQDKKLY